MKLDKLAIEEFKEYLIQSMNEDVYYQLKHWVDTQIDENQDFSEVMDFFVDNLHGSLQWID
tara:strand:- start:3935 stop:4117 length:183 start_codon:yes stop_codon:yes gene_type:complete